MIKTAKAFTLLMYLIASSSCTNFLVIKMFKKLVESEEEIYLVCTEYRLSDFQNNAETYQAVNVACEYALKAISDKERQKAFSSVTNSLDIAAKKLSSYGIAVVFENDESIFDMEKLIRFKEHQSSAVNAEDWEKLQNVNLTVRYKGEEEQKSQFIEIPMNEAESGVVILIEWVDDDLSNGDFNFYVLDADNQDEMAVGCEYETGLSKEDVLTEMLRIKQAGGSGGNLRLIL